MWGRRRKFGEKKVEKHGYRFDSKLEGTLFEMLKLLEKAGEITGLQHHPGTVFLTLARIQYRPDFCFFRNGEKEWAEAKGFEGEKWPLKKALWKFYGPGKLSIYRGSHTRIYLDEVIIPKGGDCGAQDRGQGDLSEEGESK